MPSKKPSRRKRRHPVAFLSYVHLDNKQEKQWVTKFREKLEGELQIQTGREFKIFQDRNIKWGQSWRERIDRALDATTFLIPIVTPRFFKSRECRNELERFLYREKKLGRKDLILPVYYVTVEALDSRSKHKKDVLVAVIASRQYADWRRLRFMDFSTQTVKKAFADLAVQIRDALNRRKAPRSKK
jgi:F-box protein 11